MTKIKWKKQKYYGIFLKTVGYLEALSYAHRSQDRCWESPLQIEVIVHKSLLVRMKARLCSESDRIAFPLAIPPMPKRTYL